MSAATPTEKTSWIVPQMKAPLVVSLVFHLGIFVFTLVGVPYVKPQVEMPEEAIIVEMVEIAEENQTNREPARTETRREIEKPQEEEPKKEAPPKPVAPTVTAKAPPKPVAPEVPEISIPEPQEEKAKPEPPQVKPNRKPQVEKKPDPVREPEEEETTDEDFQGLLRNLKEAEAQQASEQNDAEAVKEKPSLMTRFASKMTMSEVNALQQQLAQCWSLLAGARYAENLVVEMRLTMNPDRTVKNAQIVDQARYRNDSFFRAAADSALRAVRSPQCNPLQLPPEKYDLWKEIIVNFDPRSML